MRAKLTNFKSEDDSDDEKEVKQEDGDKAAADAASGGATKGAGPAPGKPKALPDGKKSKSLKRPGSPNLSEMESSGNESSRKRAKKQATGSVQGSRSSTPMPSSQRAKLAAGAMSDGEATGGEMSDAGRAKKKGHKVTVVSGTHGKGTPTGSRAGSPAPAAGQAPSGTCLHATRAVSHLGVARRNLITALLTGMASRFSITHPSCVRLLPAPGTCQCERRCVGHPEPAAPGCAYRQIAHTVR